MTKIKTVPALLAVLALGFIMTACRSPEVTAYKTMGTLEATVDHAMTGWADWVAYSAKIGTPVPASQEASVKQAYTAYRTAANAAYDARAAYVKNVAGGSSALEAAVAAAGTASAAVVTIVNQFLPANRQIK